MKYHVIDQDPAMHYALGEEVLGTVEADSAPQAVAKVMRSIGVDVLKGSDPAGYEKYILGTVKAVEAHLWDAAVRHSKAPGPTAYEQTQY